MIGSLCRDPCSPSFSALVSTPAPPQEAFQGLTKQLKPFAKRRGCAIERLVFFTLNALSMRLAGSGFSYISKPSSYTVKVSTRVGGQGSKGLSLKKNLSSPSPPSTLQVPAVSLLLFLCGHCTVLPSVSVSAH